MNKRIEKFCLEYIKLGNGTQAAIEAGYSKKTASVKSSQLLASTQVKEYIEQATKNYVDPVVQEFIKDKSYLQEKLYNIIEDPDIKTADRLKAIDSYARTISAYTDNVNHTGDIDIYVSLPDDLRDDNNA